MFRCPGASVRERGACPTEAKLADEAQVLAIDVEAARRESFERLFEGRLDESYRLARLILRDAQEAEDATHDAFVRAWRDHHRLRDPERFDAWLHRLTVNACLDIARHRRRRVIEVELDPIDAPTSGDLVGAVADREIVDAAMRRLDESSRAIVVLHYFLGMPLPDVAATLGIPLGTAKSRLHRSLAAMRVAIESDETSPMAIPGGQFA